MVVAHGEDVQENRIVPVGDTGKVEIARVRGRRFHGFNRTASKNAFQHVIFYLLDFAVGPVLLFLKKLFHVGLSFRYAWSTYRFLGDVSLAT